jgi:hypothetical protein
MRSENCCLGEHSLPTIDIDDVLVVGEGRDGSGNGALGNSLRRGFALEAREPALVASGGAARRRGESVVCRKRAQEQQCPSGQSASVHVW